MLLRIDDLLKTMAKIGATDLALIPSVVPRMRVADKWQLLDTPPSKPTEVREYADELLSLVPEAERRDGSGSEFIHERYGHFRVVPCNYPDTLAVLLVRLGAVS